MSERIRNQRNAETSGDLDEGARWVRDAREGLLSYQEAFTNIAAFYKRDLFLFFMHYTHDEHTTEDLYQEVMLVIIEKCSNSEFRASTNFKPWLLGLARNKYLQWYDAKRRRRWSPLPDDYDAVDLASVPPPHSDLERGAILERVETEVSSLHDHWREACFAIFAEEEDRNAFAASRGISYKALQFLLSASRKRVLDRLKHVIA